MLRVSMLLAGCLLGLGGPVFNAACLGGEGDPAEVARRIDASLASEIFSQEESGTLSLAPRIADQGFFRRANLDLIGNLPSPEQMTAFVLDPSPDKRAKVIKRLLDDERFGKNWASYWRDVILVRAADDRAYLTRESLENLLTTDFNANTPWNQTARKFIEAKGDIRENGATAIIMAQKGETPDVAAEMSRVLMGVQIQCAQCHDHPSDRWKRKQFHEFAAFFPRIDVRRDPSAAKRSFEVVSQEMERIRPRDQEMDKDKNKTKQKGKGKMKGRRPEREPREHYMPDLKDPTSKGTKMEPVFFATGQKLSDGKSDVERRTSIADWMTGSGNRWFAKAFVNRVWTELIGEGFYERVDDIGPDRPVIAPKTLEILTAEFIDHGYRSKWLYETIMLTDAYQREARPERRPEDPPFTANRAQRLRSDVLLNVLSAALGLNLDGYAFQRAGNSLGPFHNLFGFDPSDKRADITGTIPQALVMMNSSDISRQANARNPATVLGKAVAASTDDEEVITELYLRSLAREPNAEEVSACKSYIAEVNNRPQAFEDILWALLNRSEFLFRN